MFVYVGVAIDRGLKRVKRSLNHLLLQTVANYVNSAFNSTLNEARLIYTHGWVAIRTE